MSFLEVGLSEPKISGQVSYSAALVDKNDWTIYLIECCIMLYICIYTYIYNIYTSGFYQPGCGTSMVLTSRLAAKRQFDFVILGLPASFLRSEAIKLHGWRNVFPPSGGIYITETIVST
jgi:hypothetical protein